MKRLLGFSLLLLLLYHSLGGVVVAIGSWWQDQHDLSQRLTVYRSVDSLVEFQIPLDGPHDPADLHEATREGFTYHDHYYDVVSVEIRDNILFISGLENKEASFWQRDLLSFLKDTINTQSESSRKSSGWLKLLLKDYSLNSRTILHFFLYDWRQDIRIPQAPVMLMHRALPVFSPPPEI
ncbi:hypothetical protein [Rudanella lutea]|jgi:hypothetical protein|uniref:hypothetical protein n=1 Tax=Rudanella lutea TaxID=451374 RepID=UPI00036EA781|nr:hypothetical protein [Rudanella lutea]